MAFEYQKSVIGKLRKGTVDDSFVEIEETLQVVNSKVTLSEVVDELNGITVMTTDGLTSLTEIKSGTPTTDQFLCDYNQGLVHFHSSRNNERFIFSYFGRGATYLSADRVYTKQQNGDEIVETLRDVLNEADSVLDLSNRLTNKGVYSSTETYYDRNIVEYNDAAYMCINNSADGIVNIPPTDEISWRQIVNIRDGVTNVVNEELDHKGAYDSTVSYKKMNMVDYNGVVYMCILDASAGIDPLDSVYWTPIGSLTTINDQTWTATEDQTVFSLTNGNYAIDKDHIDVWVGGVLQVSGEGYTETDTVSFTLSEGVPAGTKVYAKWLEGATSITKGHVQTHKLGGNDELNVAELAGYQTEIVDKFDDHTAQLVEVGKQNVVLKGIDNTGTNDISQLVQDLIDEGYTKLYFPEGQYRFDKSVIVNRVDSLELYGDGDKNTTFIAGADLTTNCTTTTDTTNIPSTSLSKQAFFIIAPSPTGSAIRNIHFNNIGFDGTSYSKSLIGIHSSEIATSSFKNIYGLKLFATIEIDTDGYLLYFEKVFSASGVWSIKQTGRGTSWNLKQCSQEYMEKGWTFTDLFYSVMDNCTCDHIYKGNYAYNFNKCGLTLLNSACEVRFESGGTAFGGGLFKIEGTTSFINFIGGTFWSGYNANVGGGSTEADFNLTSLMLIQDTNKIKFQNVAIDCAKNNTDYEQFDMTLNNSSKVIFENSGYLVETDIIVNNASVLQFIDGKKNIIKELDSEFDVNYRSYFKAYQSVNQTLNASTWTKSFFDTKRFDKNSEYDTTNHRFVANKSGIYTVSASVTIKNLNSGTRNILVIYKNGAEVERISDFSNSTATNVTLSGATVLQLATSDYIEVFMWSGEATNTICTGITSFSVTKIS